MTLIQPTQEQIKEFWEWCGLHYTEPYWVDESGDIAFYGEVYSELLGSINPTNLFKYAVPKAMSLGWARYCEIMMAWADDFILNNKDPALALFWALYQIKEN